MSANDELVTFADHSDSIPQRNKRIKILVVDDEEVVHTVTRMVLRDVTFLGKGLEFLSAFSAREAREIFAANPDIAVALVDVVMESDDAGLELVRWIREELNNSLVRIVLRTGQPGQAPEQEIIRRYEINDYKEKTELTNVRLITTITVALRGYHDIMTIEESRRGFRRIIDATSAFWASESIKTFTEEVITQFGHLVADGDSALFECSGLGATDSEDGVRVVAGTGHYQTYVGRKIAEIQVPDVKELVNRAFRERHDIFSGTNFATFLPAKNGPSNVLFVHLPRETNENQRNLIRVFSGNVALTFENLSLSLRMDSAQRETIFMLGELVEMRSQATGNHVRRVGRIVRMLADLAGEPSQTADIWHLGSSLHDIGKIVIPDTILNKPGRLTDQEFAIMKTHTLVGKEMLSRYDDELMQCAASVAHFHHEKWDGSGYPNGFAGESIPVEARLTAIADVFDALTHKRTYKDPWGVDDAFSYVLERAGSEFDPGIVELFSRLRSDVGSLLEELPD